MLIRYEIKEIDLLVTKFPYTKVLQSKWGKVVNTSLTYLNITPALAKFKTSVAVYIREYKKYKISDRPSIEQVNIDIYKIVSELEKEFPKDFQQVGWYTKEVLASMYAEGRLAEVTPTSKTTKRDIS